MTDAERAYWSVLAQIMPVLALALVLELRTVVQALQMRRSPDRPSAFLVGWQVLILAVAGLCVALVTIESVAALRLDRVPPAFSQFLVRFAIPVAVGGLILTPISNASVAAGIGGGGWTLARWSPSRIRSRFRFRRALNSNMRSVIDVRSIAHSAFVEATATRADSLWTLHRVEAANAAFNTPGEHHEKPEVRDAQRKAEELLVQARRVFGKSDELLIRASREWRTAVVREHNYGLYRQEVLRADKAAHSAHDENLRLLLWARGAMDAVTGFRAPRGRIVALKDDAPDDGGFLHSDPVPHELPDFDVNGDWLHDPSELYTDPSRRIE